MDDLTGSRRMGQTPRAGMIRFRRRSGMLARLRYVECKTVKGHAYGHRRHKEASHGMKQKHEARGPIKK